jgi:hypothetical protein
MLYHYLPAIAHVLIIIWIILSMQRPFILPYAYSIFILLFTIIIVAVFILLLLLFCYCYCYKIVTTDKLLWASLFPGAAELTTHLLRPINILWHPLCQIDKFGFTSLEDCCDPLYLWVIKHTSRSTAIRTSSPSKSWSIVMRPIWQTRRQFQGLRGNTHRSRKQWGGGLPG